MKRTDQRGIALITTLLVMALMSAMLMGFTAVVMYDQRYRFIDRDRGQAFYAASGGIEKLTVDLGNTFFTNVAPTNAQVTALTADTARPTIDGVTFTGSVSPSVLATSSLNKCGSPNSVRTVGSTGYTISFCAGANGNPTTTGAVTPIKTGPYQGLLALQSPYQLDVSAKTATGGDTHLVRSIESVAIPVFQFGMFSDVDLAFFAGPNFGFGGRVHTNGNLFLSQGDGATLTLSDKVTAVGEIIRQKLENGASIDTASAHTGTVNVAKAPGVFRALARTEGSLTQGIGSSQNEPTWHTISLSTYNSWIRNGRTGATTLKLPLVTAGGSNPDLVRRPVSGEDSGNPIVYGERLFTKASLRILLSDTATDITSLPSVTSTTPVQLDGNWRSSAPSNGASTYGPVDASHPPIARSAGLVSATTSSSNSTSSGTGKTITFSSIPASWQLPTLLHMTVTGSGAGDYLMTCTGKTYHTPSTSVYALTGCLSSGTPWPGLTSSNTAQIYGSVTTLDGNTLTLPTINVDLSGSGTTLQSGSTSTARAVKIQSASAAKLTQYSTNTFFTKGGLITCGSYTSTTLDDCTVPNTIAGSEVVSNGYASTSGTGTIGGYIKIEKQDTSGLWTDVTMEILNYGIAGPNIGGTACADPTPNAILRIQRLRDNNWTTCDYGPGYPTQAQTPSTDYWPNVLFDTREALQRDTAPASSTTIILGGVMYYIALDVANLSKWFTATAPYATGSGAGSKIDNTGYTVYFSDRRNNRDSAGHETGEYGWEDFVNSDSPTGAPNSMLDTGEDVNGNNTLDVYGGVPNYNGTYNTAPPGASAPLTTAGTPLTTLNVGQAQVNRAILFRHALKLINGASIASLGVNGLSIVSENPVYIQGNWNANGTFSGAHAATSVLADAVTLLTSNWSDSNSFANAYAPGSRTRGGDSWYRLAIVAGKGMAFPQPTGTATDFGTDGGVHNFLRYLQSSDGAVNYSGAISTFYYNRQAVGTYKCCNTVYSAPTRNYAFDTDFLTPSLLPPNTPVFRDFNTVGFAQEIRPGR